MLRWARGLVCMPCDAGRLDALDVWPMVPADRAGCDTAVHACRSTTSTAGSGIGAADRALTIRQIARPPTPCPTDFQRPGHVFPLRARPGGVLERRGHTEAAVDLARLAGLPPVAVICEVLHDDGSPARGSRTSSCSRRSTASRWSSVDQIAEHRLALDDTDAYGLRTPLLL